MMVRMMARQIDADELLRAMNTWDKFGLDSHGYMRRITKDKNTDLVPYVHYDDMLKAVNGMPTSEAAPVIHARWEGTWYDSFADGYPVYEEWKCSNCGAEFRCEDMDFDYCPRCGAKMDQEYEEDEAD